MNASYRNKRNVTICRHVLTYVILVQLKWKFLRSYKQKMNKEGNFTRRLTGRDINGVRRPGSQAKLRLSCYGSGGFILF